MVKCVGVGSSTAINWVRRLRETGSVAPARMGGHRPKLISGKHRLWLLQRIKEGEFTLRGLVAELAERGLKVDYRTVWNFVHAEKPASKKAWWLANATDPTSRDGAHSGANIKTRSSLSVWSLSMRLGQDQHGTAAWMGSARQKGQSQGAVRSLEYNNLLGCAAFQSDRGAVASRGSDQSRPSPRQSVSSWEHSLPGNVPTILG